MAAKSVRSGSKLEECGTVADLLREGSARNQMLTVAEQYARLADQYDRTTKRVGPPKPAV